MSKQSGLQTLFAVPTAAAIVAARLTGSSETQENSTMAFRAGSETIQEKVTP